MNRYDGKMERIILNGENESTGEYIGLIKEVATCLEMKFGSIGRLVVFTHVRLDGSPGPGVNGNDVRKRSEPGTWQSPPESSNARPLTLLSGQQ